MSLMRLIKMANTFSSPPALSLADQCITDSQIFATPTKNINSKTNFTAQSVMLHDNGYGETIIGANPYTAELIVKKIIQKKLWNPYPKYKICKETRTYRLPW